MKLVILNKNDGKGGAARAASTWHKTMLKNGINSSFLVENITSSIPSTISPISKQRKIYNYFKTHFDDAYLSWKYPNRYKYPWGINVLPTNIHHEINALQPDLVNLHWISNETISWNEIAKIELLQKKKITIVASSNWLKACFKASPVFGNLDIHVVPNPLDIDIFKPIDKFQARHILNLPKEKKLILFMAFSATTDPRKGVQYLPAMLEELEKTYSTDELELVVVGAASNNGSINTKFKSHFLGTISDDWSLTLLYSACDTMIAPSTEENLSLAVMESMACGTPVVAFDIGGMPDMITHKQNGFLAKAFDPTELAVGIQFVLQNKFLNSNARKHVVENYNYEQIFNQAMSVFRKVAGKQ
jgi:glycosyltransferase involved in cell wall biosynthesis